MKNIRSAIGFLKGFVQSVKHGKDANNRWSIETKKEKRLSARIKDWGDTVNAAHNRGRDMAGYNKPGSLNG